MTRSPPKNLIFVFRSSLDEGHINTGLDAALLAGTFDQEVSLLLLGDAVNLLTNNPAENNSLQARLAQLQTFGVKHIYVDTGALARFPVDLLLHHEFLIPVDGPKIKQLIHTNQTVAF